MKESIIQIQNFIMATRDSGYKSTASALAELVDNAIESGASKVNIQIKRNPELFTEEFELHITDNGCGMNAHELGLALQFGGSTRFNSRRHLGRYGMGLPNSSLSQCRRVEVISWKKESEVLSNYLDVDEVIENNWNYLNPVVRGPASFLPQSASGTVVIWRKCDRLSYRYLKSLIKHIHFELGRIFRYAIWRGVEIRIDQVKVTAFDPMYSGEGINMIGGTPYGKELKYRVKVPGDPQKISLVRVRFVELPVLKWAMISNEEKRKQLICKSAGVSILRGEREIDFGWFFMGDKRKENYDDWWRCEISFSPELDEAFGVTHTKQEIKETEYICGILVPDIEQTARALNNRVRVNFSKLRKEQPLSFSKVHLERTDIYLAPLKGPNVSLANFNYNIIRGMNYEVVTKELTSDSFYDISQVQNKIILTINTTHLFYDKVFKALHDRKIESAAEFIKIMEFVIFAAGRSELTISNKNNIEMMRDFKKEWSSQLKTFIS